jgi:hypothetical protein
VLDRGARLATRGRPGVDYARMLNQIKERSAASAFICDHNICAIRGAYCCRGVDVTGRVATLNVRLVYIISSQV